MKNPFEYRTCKGEKERERKEVNGRSMDRKKANKIC